MRIRAFARKQTGGRNDGLVDVVVSDGDFVFSRVGLWCWGIVGLLEVFGGDSLQRRWEWTSEEVQDGYCRNDGYLGEFCSRLLEEDGRSFGAFS